ncbi:LOW QUALITY PROTEIN: clavesin-1-like [Dendronephthya gigantea]|uniref:LOW QUALITY PROTEIN: clavesin-1-like n=1 Tax=Dendronephthya gigantea TaxID=151771 RepID=UPI00106BC11A|nr:LOW QUALITY PROTEIN: clavesin-1-like [Dendronephthya gigantea]
MSFGPGFSSGLSAKTKEKAKAELNEDPLTRNAKVQLLRDKMVFRPDLPFRKTDEKYLLRFLRARKFDEERAFQLLCSHIEFKRKNRDLFEDLTLTKLRPVLQEGFPGVLENRDSNGSRVLVLFPGRWERELFDFKDIVKALIFTMEELITEEETQVNGIVAIVDFTGWSLSKHGRYITVRELRSVVKIFQECFPARVKAIHLINQPWYINLAIKSILPFLKAKIGDRLHLHGNNLTSLHMFIHPDLLPSEFGGNEPGYDKLSWLRTVMSKNSFQHTCATMIAVAEQLNEHLKHDTEREN